MAGEPDTRAGAPGRGAVAVVGTGTMGAGIAQLAAVAGHRVLLADADPAAARRAVSAIRDRAGALVAKGRLDLDPEALDLTVAAVAGLGDCEYVVEAIAEDLGAKRRLFAELEQVVAPSCVLASNTSSLSPTALAAGLRHPGRVVGLHFFNPAPVMRLVELVCGLATAPAVADRAAALARGWGKTVVRSAATPGFIVNRIARPYYAEAWRLHEEHGIEPAVIDAVLTGAGGFRLGPFALMDLIGHDVNEAVTRSVWTAFGCDPRFTPSLAQRALVDAGWLGRKTGRGCYRYDGAAGPPAAAPAPPRDPPAQVVTHGTSPLRALLARSAVPVRAGRDSGGAELPGGAVELPGGAVLLRCTGQSATALSAAAGRPVIVVDRALDDATATAVAVAACDGCPAPAVAQAAGLFQAAGLAVFVIDDAPGLIVTRTVAMLANLAADALARRVATAGDIDAAMRLGTGYPQGPLAWAGRWGTGTVLAVLDALEDSYRDGHYRASPLLRRRALAGQPLA